MTHGCSTTSRPTRPQSDSSLSRLMAANRAASQNNRDHNASSISYSAQARRSRGSDGGHGRELCIGAGRSARNARGHYPVIYRWVESTGPCVLIWMWAVLGLRLFRTRPPLWRLARQPGILACLVGLFGFGLSCIHAGALSYPTSADVWLALTVEIAHGISGEILIAWLTLAVTGQWRPMPDWFDRVGRVLGTYVIIVFWFGPLAAAYLNKFA